MFKFYNPLLPIEVSCDVSEKGLGAVLEQNENKRWHPIAYASRTLNKPEQNYCQLEHLFTCTMTIFHSNQHLPNLLSNRPHAFTRFLLRLQKYNFEMHYIQGSLLI